VPVNVTGYAKEAVKPFLEKQGVKVFGIFPRDKFLESVTVRRLHEILGGSLLCCEDRLDEHVENFLIGAMDVDSALNYFRRAPNKAVITGAHRSDIQLAALETSTKCIILTGGLSTNEVVVGKARTKGVPIITVADDTFTAIDKIELSMGKTSIREKRKVERAKELFSAGFDMYGFLESLKG
jgi:BioD-like phosphotransacetylase family protein